MIIFKGYLQSGYNNALYFQWKEIREIPFVSTLERKMF